MTPTFASWPGIWGASSPAIPTLIVTNKPGAGGLLALNHAGNLAPRDGTFMTLVQQAILLHEPMGAPGLQTSLKQLNWIGNLSQSNNLVVTWHTSPVKTIEDAKICGGHARRIGLRFDRGATSRLSQCDPRHALQDRARI